MAVIVKQIAHVSKLDLFTSEITIDEKGKFFVIDYVNDQPDMRKKSKFNNGVPDEIVNKITNDIINFIKKKAKG